MDGPEAAKRRAGQFRSVLPMAAIGAKRNPNFEPRPSGCVPEQTLGQMRIGPFPIYQGFIRNSVLRMRAVRRQGCLG
jgi:hypothetical protein